MAHRFDGLDLFLTLIGVLCIAFVLGVIWYVHRREEDSGALSDEWWQYKMTPAGTRYSEVDAQFLLYEVFVNPDDPITYIANEDQAKRVFEAVSKSVRKETGRHVLLPSAMVDDWHDAYIKMMTDAPPEYQFYNWREIPEWAEDLDG